MITFNTSNNVLDSAKFSTVTNWLTALYTSSNLNESTEVYIESLDILEKKLAYQFKNKSNFITSLTHKSFSNEFKNKNLENNEKLEFLGDSILNAIITSELFWKYPDLNEGELSKFRGSLVNEHSFSDLADYLNLGDSLFLGKGELKAQGFSKNSLKADAFEAIFGGIFIEVGFDQCKEIFTQMILKVEKENEIEFYSLKNASEFDPKSSLQEEVMKKYMTIPEYRFFENGTLFEVELWINDRLILKDIGNSKKRIEKELAKKALSNHLI